MAGKLAGADLDALVTGDAGRLGRLGDARAEGGADARSRLEHALQARAHAEGRAPLPRRRPRRWAPRWGWSRTTARLLAEAERRGLGERDFAALAGGRRGALGRAPLAVERRAAGVGQRRRRASGARSRRSPSRTAPRSRCRGRRPRRVQVIRPATSDPPIPISIVWPRVMGSLPGSASRASAPTTRPLSAITIT